MFPIYAGGYTFSLLQQQEVIDAEKKLLLMLHVTKTEKDIG